MILKNGKYLHKIQMKFIKSKVNLVIRKCLTLLTEYNNNQC